MSVDVAHSAEEEYYLCLQRFGARSILVCSPKVSLQNARQQQKWIRPWKTDGLCERTHGHASGTVDACVQLPLSRGLSERCFSVAFSCSSVVGLSFGFLAPNSFWPIDALSVPPVLCTLVEHGQVRPWELGYGKIWRQETPECKACVN